MHSQLRMRRRPKGNLRASTSERLERRLLLSAFYDYQVLAQTGQATASGDTITAINFETSGNDNGRAAFVASVATGTTILTADGRTAPRTVSFPFPSATRVYDLAQIANDDQVVSRDRVTGASPAFFVRTWDANNTGSFNVIAKNGDQSPDGAGPYDILQLPTRANDGGTAFVGFIGSTSSLYYYRGNTHSTLGIVSGGGLRPMAGDGGRVVMRNGNSGAQSIMLYTAGGATQTLADPAHFSAVSQAGISDDGTVVAFAGNSIADGKGIFLSYLDGASFTTPVKVAGFPNELGYDSAGNGLFLNDFDFSDTTATFSDRVGVDHVAGGPAGIQGDTILLSFIATPNAASRDNPHLAGTPLLFSAKQGLWTMKVIPDKPLSGAGAIHFNRRTSPVPVVQVDDMIAGQAVTGVSIFDPIATAAKDPAGNVRATVNPTDHYVVFRAATAAGAEVVRAAQFDTDGDGLFDHWEKAGGGVDIDRDGTPDLNLSAMGAKVDHKDLFLEIDWLKPDAPTHRNFAPQPQALSTFAAMFANDPLTNPDGTTGVTVHIDGGGGAGLSLNMGTGSLQGGDLIAQAGTGNHIHVLYMGNADPVAANPGLFDRQGRPLVSRSFEDVKRNFFSTTDKDSRELVFRYAVFADAYGIDTSGGAARLDPSTGIAESPYFDGTLDGAGNPVDFRSATGNDLIVSLQGSRSFSGGRLSVPLGGPPATVAEPVGFIQAQTLAHEFGHTLSLLHGGFDMTTSGPPTPGTPAAKPNYRSLMNYAYQLDPDPTGALVRDYSRAGDAVFNDYSIIDLGFAENFSAVGNTLNPISRFGAVGGALPPSRDVDFTLDQIEARQGPLDDQAPSVAITSPTDNSPVPVNSPLTVNLTATDNIGVTSVTVSFDADGDGTISPDETVTATPTGNGTYQATFPNVTGPAGGRTIVATAADAATFTDSQSVPVNVTTGVQPPPKVVVSAFHFDGLPHTLSFTFSQDVRASLTPGDFFIRKTDGSGPITPAAVTYDDASNTATITFPSGATPDGRYVVTLSSAGIATSGGLNLDGDGNGTPGPDFDFGFFFLAGDANHDATVDFNDLVRLAQNYNTAGGRTFDQGDFNYDGNVDFNDLVILAQRYNTNLPVAAPPATAAATGTHKQNPLFSTTPVRPVAKPRPAKSPAHRGAK